MISSQKIKINLANYFVSYKKKVNIIRIYYLKKV